MFQIITASHPSSDLSRPSIILQSDSSGKRYLFGNIPEGAQRHIHERKLGLNKIDKIFLTGKIDWNSIGGLPGFILTSADQGRKRLELNYGGADRCLKYLISSWRYFLFRFGLDVKLNEFNEADLVTNDGFNVRAVSIASSQATTESQQNPAQYDQLSSLVDRVFPLTSSTPRDSLSLIKLPNIEVKSTQSCNYIIEFHPQRGKFLVAKLKLLKVPLGPLFAKLANGGNVTLSDGSVITSDQVLDKPRTFGKVLVLDIPSEDYLKQTLLYDWGDNDYQCVYHFLGDELSLELVLQSLEYTKFFQKFEKAKHFISHRDLCSDSINFHASALITLKLKSINNELFRLPNSNESQLSISLGENIYILNSSQSVTIKADSPFKLNDNTANTLDTKYWDKLYDENVKPLNFNFYTKSEILSGIKEHRKIVDDVEIITLGTGSALPSQYRNVISTILRIPSSSSSLSSTAKGDEEKVFNSIILDAGENTIGSMKRLFTNDEFVKFYQTELSMIYLSHLHADHHLGIISLIDNFNKFNINNRKLYIVCPWQYDFFLKEWFKFNDNLNGLQNIVYLNCDLFETNPKKRLWPGVQYEFNDLNNLSKLPKLYQKDFDAIGIAQGLLSNMKIKEIKTCKAIHCEWAYSVSITFNNGFKVSYSGDTRPCMDFAKIGEDSDLLIHEATLEDELIMDLIDKKHTTISELKQILLLMKLKNLVLTHFSQRYPRLPILGNNGQEIDAKIVENCLKCDGKFSVFQYDAKKQLDNFKIIYAFDNMWFKLNDIHLQYEKFEKIDMSFLEKLFVVDDDNDDDAGIITTNGRKRSSDVL